MARPSRRIRDAIVAIATIAAAAVQVLVIGLVIVVQPKGSDPLVNALAAASGLSLVVAGGVLVSRVPQNPVSWMLWISGLAVTLSTASAGLGQAFSVNPERVAGAIWLAWLNQWLAPAFLGLIALTPLLYPTGRLPSPRWRIVLVLGVVGLILDIVVAALSPFTGDMYAPEVQNPTALGPESADLLAALTTANALISGVAYLLIVASLVVRYRRSKGVEREQLKWFAYVGALSLVALLVGVATGFYLAWVAFFTGLALLPVAIMLAVLRYRLYDIDLVIRRTLVYGALATFLALVYGGSVLLLSTALAPLASGNSLAVAGGTLVVAALFSPVRRRVQASVDRRFFRSRYDSTAELAALNRRLRGRVDLDGLRTEIAGTVGRTLQPASATVWLRGERAPIRRG